VVGEKQFSVLGSLFSVVGGWLPQFCLFGLGCTYGIFSLLGYTRDADIVGRKASRPQVAAFFIWGVI